jgi:hypothetical protein
MKTKMLMAGWLMAAILISVQSCKDDEEESAPEFVASSSDFSGFRSWTQVATHQGPSPSLGEAHHGNDATVTRTIYVKNNQERGSDGKFPVGTLVVKETKKDGATIEMTAMVKRGNNFNPENNDWEWFMLNGDGTIMTASGSEMRGAKLMDGMCGACHSQVKSKDFVFSK